MKRIIQIILSLLVAGCTVISCEFKYPEAHVLPDPVFALNGLQKYQTVAIYPETTIELDISRVYGLSKEIEIYLGIDETLIGEYNALYSTSYGMMPAEFYKIPESVTFVPDSQGTKVPVTIYVQNLVAEFGIEKARNMVIPIEIMSASMEIEDAESMGYVLVNMDIQEPTIEVVVPEKTDVLEFIPAIPLTQSINISANVNFDTMDAEKITWMADESKVDEFNNENDMNCLPLPSDRYIVNESVFDSENGVLTTEIVFDCSSIGGDEVYVCPLVMKQKDAGYNVVQKKPVYVVIEMSELRIWTTDGGSLLTSTTGEGQIEFQMNSPMTEIQNINLLYDPDAVDTYNGLNGTSYVPLEAAKVSITSSSIVPGSRTGSVGYSIDIKDMPYDGDVAFMAAFSVDEDCLVPGTVIQENSTVYVKIFKTLSGVYTKTETVSVFKAKDSSADFQNVIYLADGKTLCGPAGSQKIVPESGHGQKYAVYYNSNLWVYFDISEEEMEGHPGCYKLINFRDRVEGYDEITENASYFDPVNEEFIFDFITLGWWAPGGGGGNELENPDDLPGELWHAKLSDRQ